MKRDQFCDGYKRDLWFETLPDPGNPDVSQHSARDLIVEIGRAAHYDGPSLSIGRWNNSLARMEVRNGSDGLHLDPQDVEFWGFSGFRPDTRQRDALKIHYGGWADLRKSD